LCCWVVLSTISCFFVSLSSVAFVPIWIDVHTIPPLPLSSCNRGSFMLVISCYCCVAFRLWISRSVRFGAMAEFVLGSVCLLTFFILVLSLNALLSRFFFNHKIHFTVGCFPTLLSVSHIPSYSVLV
jgi:hypothetical protein